MSNRFRMHRAGFTLIEVLLVIAILVTLATGGVVGYMKIQQSANVDHTRVLVEETKRAVNLYQLQMNRPPSAEEGLGALITPPDDERQAERWNEKGPFLANGVIPIDSWGNELKYVLAGDGATGAAFHVYSFGPNGVDDNGGEDDIPRWAQ